MKRDEFDAFKLQFARIMMVFTSIPATGEVAAVWFEALEDLELQDVAAGIKKYVRYGDDFPIPSKVRDMANECRSRRKEDEREAFFRKTGRLMHHDGTIGKTNEEIAEQKAKERACAERMRAKREAKEADEKAAKAEAAIAAEAAREARRIAFDAAAVKAMQAVDTPEDPLARLRAASTYHQLRAKLNNELDAANSRAGRPTTGITSGQNAQGVPS